MILRFFPTKDATIYEQSPNKNTGLDAIIEVTKTIDGASSYSSRILLDFDYSSASASIASFGYTPNLFNWKLKLFAAEARELPIEYTLYCYPLSQSWSMGVGRYGNLPETTTGVSWTYRQSAAATSTKWLTSSFAANSTGSWTTRAGGGVWFTASVASQSYSYTTADAEFDVTPIVRQIQSGSIDFKGFIIKRSTEDEASLLDFGSIKFFSKETHTVFSPYLEATFDDSLSSSSLAEVNTNEDFNIIATTLQPVYKEQSAPIIRFSARPRYQMATFATSSVFLTRYKLPTNTQFAVYNAHSDDKFISFGDYTKLSHDNEGSYFRLPMDGLQPERYYRIVLKVPYSGSSFYQIFDNNWIFKVERNQ